MPTITVLLCEKDAQVRTYWQMLLHNQRDLRLAACSTDPDQLLAQALRIKPQVVVIGAGCLEALKRLRHRLPNTGVLIYSTCTAIEAMLACLAEGAKGYVLWQTPPHRLLEAVREVSAGGAYVSPCMSSKLLAHFFAPPEPAADYQLCDRELNILRLLTEGLPTKVIAGRVYLSEDGVKKNLKNIYTKLSVSCGKEAVAKAVRERLV